LVESNQAERYITDYYLSTKRKI